MELVFGHMDGRNHGRMDGWTDRRGSRNSYLDFAIFGGSCDQKVLLKISTEEIIEGSSRDSG